MRRLSGLAMLLAGCQLLPTQDVSCPGNSVCPTPVTMPFVLGQPDAMTNWMQTGLGRVAGLLMMSGKLIASDTNNNRVLIWNSFPTRNNQPPDIVLGAPNLSVLLYSGPDAQLIYQPTAIASDGTSLLVGSDTGSNNGHPITVWNPFPTANFAAYANLLDPGGNPSPSASTFLGGSPLLVNGHLYLSDRGFNRMMLWNAVPQSLTTGADYIFGQSGASTGMANGGGMPNGNSFNNPHGSPASDGTMLYVPDTQNNRVLGYAMLPTMASNSATFALGQTSLTGSSANAGVTSLQTLNTPNAVAVGNSRLAVSDSGNNRVLLWNTLPTSNGQAASVALGQPNGGSTASNYGGLSASSLYSPSAVATDGTRLAVGDGNNSRILLWNSWPAMNGTPADLVLGQPNMNSRIHNGEFASATRLANPSAVAHAGTRFFVVDSDAHRVLMWPTFPQDPSALPTLVLGQPDMNSSQSNNMGTSATSLSNPTSVSSDGTVLAVADNYNNRVLLWNSIPTTNRQAANVVVGQASTTSSDTNDGGAPVGLNSPFGVYVGNGRLYVADSGNNRVLIWKSIPTQNGQAPDIVLGQSDFNGTLGNHGSPGADATTLFQPNYVYSDGSHIFVSEYGQNRLLIWNTLDPSNGQGADVELGAGDFKSYGSIYGPGTAQVYAGRLFLPDGGGSRILVWKSVPTQSGTPPDMVLGQANSNSTTPNYPMFNATTLQRPSGVLATDIGIYIADSGNGRIVVLPPLPPP